MNIHWTATGTEGRSKSRRIGRMPRMPPSAPDMVGSRLLVDCVTGFAGQHELTPTFWLQTLPEVRLAGSTVGAAMVTAARERIAKSLVSCIMPI